MQAPIVLVLDDDHPRRYAACLAHEALWLGHVMQHGAEQRSIEAVVGEGDAHAVVDDRIDGVDEAEVGDIEGRHAQTGPVRGRVLRIPDFSSILRELASSGTMRRRRQSVPR